MRHERSYTGRLLTTLKTVTSRTEKLIYERRTWGEKSQQLSRIIEDGGIIALATYDGQ